MNDLTKHILLWVVMVLVPLLVFSRYMPTVGQQEEIHYSTFLEDVKANRVDSVVLQGEWISGVRKDKSQFKTYNPGTDHTALIGTLEKSNVAIEGKPPRQPNFQAQLLLQLAPALLLILVFVYMLRRVQGASGGRGAMSSGTSRARGIARQNPMVELTLMQELVFEVTQEADGGFVAESLGEGVTTQADTWDELRGNVREAVEAYFFDRTPPKRIRLRLVRDEVLVTG